VKQFAVTIRGTADILFNAFEVEGDEPGSKPARVAKDYSGEWREKLYLLEDGTLYQPEAHLVGCLVRAGATEKIPGRRGKTYKDAVKGGLFIEPACIPHKANLSDFEGAPVLTGPLPDGKKAIAYIDRRPVRVQRAMVIRYRPALRRGWELSFVVQVLDDDFREDALKAILDTGGREIGIGDFRPRFGRFVVSHFEQIKQKSA